MAKRCHHIPACHPPCHTYMMMTRKMIIRMTDDDDDWNDDDKNDDENMSDWNTHLLIKGTVKYNARELSASKKVVAYCCALQSKWQVSIAIVCYTGIAAAVLHSLVPLLTTSECWPVAKNLFSLIFLLLILGCCFNNVLTFSDQYFILEIRDKDFTFEDVDNTLRIFNLKAPFQPQDYLFSNQKYKLFKFHVDTIEDIDQYTLNFQP